MPKIMLGDFADVVSKSGSPKATKVAQIKNRPDYSPITDFYKPLRDAIIEVHQSGGEKKALSAVMKGVQDQKKQSNYPAAIAGYQKWWGRKKVAWVKPTTGLYSYQGIEVSVNPEIGLTMDGVKHIIKLHLKADALVKNRADLITGLMELTLRENVGKDCVVGILDVRNAKLFRFGSDLHAFHAMVDSELAYVAAIWDRV